MKKYIITFLPLFCFALFAQFKKDNLVNPADILLNKNEQNGILSNNLQIHHRLAMGYSSSANNSMMGAEYVMGLAYQFEAPVLLAMELGVMNIPFSSMPLPSEEKTRVYLKSASLEYQPSEDFRMKLEFNSYPSGYQNSLFNNHRSFFKKRSSFFDDNNKGNNDSNDDENSDLFE